MSDAVHPLQELKESARLLLTLFGPRVSASQDENPGVRYCEVCNPPPKVYQCFICGFGSEAKWRWKLHVDLNPKWCQDYAAKWAKRYAEMNA